VGSPSSTGTPGVTALGSGGERRRRLRGVTGLGGRVSGRVRVELGCGSIASTAPAMVSGISTDDEGGAITISFEGVESVEDGIDVDCDGVCMDDVIASGCSKADFEPR
jgi:hypothetical protein